VRLQAHSDAPAFLAAAAPVLAGDEARHNLVYGICSTLVDVPEAYPTAHLWTVADDAVVGAAVMTPPFNVVVARPLDPDVMSFAARVLHEEGIAVPGVTGAVPEVGDFARAWQELTGAGLHLRMSQGIYAAREVQLPEGTPGGSRPARPEDRKVVVDWLRAFQAEALPADAPQANLDALFERRLVSSTAGFELWDDGSKPVSLCGYGGRTPHGIRIGPVYTPPELRGRGYGSALTAALTQQLLDGGRRFCFLFTDLANPTSNSIYQRIGYRPVSDVDLWSFD